MHVQPSCSSHVVTGQPPLPSSTSNICYRHTCVALAITAEHLTGLAGGLGTLVTAVTPLHPRPDRVPRLLHDMHTCVTLIGAGRLHVTRSTRHAQRATAPPPLFRARPPTADGGVRGHAAAAPPLGRGPETHEQVQAPFTKLQAAACRERAVAAATNAPHPRLRILGRLLPYLQHDPARNGHATQQPRPPDALGTSGGLP